jgi:hypothetical protein
MNVIVMVQKDNPVAPENYACGECRMFWGTQRTLAEECCGPRTCTCGARIERKEGYSHCRDCRAKAATERENERFAKATKVTNAQYEHEPVYYDGHGGDYGDGYWSTLEALLEHCEQHGCEPPEYVWGCAPKVLTLDGSDIVSRALEDEFFEDAFDTIAAKDLAELDAFLTAWCTKVNLQAWDVDYGTAVLVSAEARGNVLDACPEDCGHLTFHDCSGGTHCDQHCTCTCNRCAALNAAARAGAAEPLGLDPLGLEPPTES